MWFVSWVDNIWTVARVIILIDLDLLPIQEQPISAPINRSVNYTNFGLYIDLEDNWEIFPIDVNWG